MMKKDAFTLWEQEGDLDRMKLFFQEVRPDPEEKERIKKLALEKLREEELKTASGGSPRNILISEISAKESLREKAQRRFKSFWWRWQWKLAVPVVAIFMFAFIGIGMEGLKNSSTGMDGGFKLKFSTQNSIASDSAGAEAPRDSGRQSLENAPNYGIGAPEMDIMVGTAKENYSDQKIAPIMPIPEPQAPPAEESLAKKLIYNMHASLQVEDVSAALARVTQEITALGGYVVQSSESSHQNSSSAYATFKIPSQQLEGFKGRLAEFGKVLDNSTESTDITNEYYDTQSRLKNLTAQEARYLEILKEANTVQDILHIESYLSSTRMQIEQLQGQVKLWDHQVTYSTVNISFRNTPSPVSINDPWQPISWASTWQAAKDAVLKTISSTWNGVNYLVVGIAYALPYLLAGLGLFGGYKVIRRSRGK